MSIVGWEWMEEVKRSGRVPEKVTGADVGEGGVNGAEAASLVNDLDPKGKRKATEKEVRIADITNCTFFLFFNYCHVTDWTDFCSVS